MYKNMSLFSRRIYTFHLFYSRSMVDLTNVNMNIRLYYVQQTFNDVGNEKVYMGDDWKGVRHQKTEN